MPIIRQVKEIHKTVLKETPIGELIATIAAIPILGWFHRKYLEWVFKNED
jgi:hypothetical protein